MLWEKIKPLLNSSLGQSGASSAEVTLNALNASESEVALEFALLLVVCKNVRKLIPG